MSTTFEQAPTVSKRERLDTEFASGKNAWYSCRLENSCYTLSYKCDVSGDSMLYKNNEDIINYPCID